MQLTQNKTQDCLVHRALASEGLNPKKDSLRFWETYHDGPRRYRLPAVACFESWASDHSRVRHEWHRDTDTDGHANTRGSRRLSGPIVSIVTVTLGRRMSRFTAGLTCSMTISVCAGGWTLAFILQLRWKPFAERLGLAWFAETCRVFCASSSPMSRGSSLTSRHAADVGDVIARIARQLERKRRA
jgi:hypothetical protein